MNRLRGPHSLGYEPGAMLGSPKRRETPLTGSSQFALTLPLSIITTQFWKAILHQELVARSEGVENIKFD